MLFTQPIRWSPWPLWVRCPLSILTPAETEAQRAVYPAASLGTRKLPSWVQSLGQDHMQMSGTDSVLCYLTVVMLMLEKKRRKGKEEEKQLQWCAVMYVCRTMKALRCDTNEGFLLIVKIFLVSSWAGSPFLCSVLSKVLLSLFPFCPAPCTCLSSFRLCCFTGEGQPRQRIHRNHEKNLLRARVLYRPGFPIDCSFGH